MSEEKRLRDYRQEQFVRLGFTDENAALLATWEVDWHKAEDLLNAGCPHDTALSILQPD